MICHYGFLIVVHKKLKFSCKLCVSSLVFIVQITYLTRQLFFLEFIVFNYRLLELTLKLFDLLSERISVLLIKLTKVSS